MSVSATPTPPKPAQMLAPTQQRQPHSMPNTPAAAVYPTTTSAGWTVVHHGTLGPPEAYHAHASSSSSSGGGSGSSGGRRSHSQSNARLPISSAAAPWRPPPAKDPRPLPVPPPLDTVSVGSTTFTRRPLGRGQSSEREKDRGESSSKGKRRASISDATTLLLPPSALSPSSASPSSTTSSRPLPLPPPVSPSPSNAVAGPGPSSSRQPQKPKAGSRQQRPRTPDAGLRAGMHLNASQERLGYSYTPPSTSASAHPAHTTRSPTMPFDGVSGVWTKPRPAADSHPRNNAIATANGDASTTRRSPSRDRDRTRTRTTSASSDQRPNLIRTTSGGAISGSSSSSSVLGGKQPSLTNLRRKTSGDAQMQAQMGILPSSRKGSGDSVSGSGGLGRSESLQRKTSGGILRAPTSASVSGHGPPRKSSLGSGNPAIRTAASSPAHSRNPSLTTPLVIPVYNPPMTMATSSHSSATSHSYSAHSLPSGSGSGLLPPVPPPPPLQHPIRKGSDESARTTSPPITTGLIIPMGPVPKSFVPPPPPPPLPLLLAGKGPPPLPPPSQSLPPTPPSPSPNQNLPTLKMSAALLARRDALAGGAAAYTNSPAPLSDVSTPSSAKSAPPGSGFSWRYSTDASDSPMTGLTTPATSWDSGGGRDKSVYAGSPLASATVFGALPSPGPQGKRERRRLQLHSPIDIAALSPDAESGPLTPPIHSHPIGDESEEGGGPDSAVSEKPRGWLAALEGQVGEEEMEGVLLSPPTFAARKLDPDEMDDIGLDALDLYDDGVDDVDEGADRGRRGRSPSPIRYARRASVDHDMIFSDSSDEDEYGMSDPLGDTVSFDSPAPSLDNVSNSHNNNSDAKSIFNDARSTFSRARSTRSRRKWRNTRVAPPPVPLGSASGMGMNGDGKRKQRARSADSSIIGFGGEAMAPSEMWRKEQAAAKAATQPTGEMRFVYQASQARLPASVPPPPPMMMMNMGNSMGSLQQYDSASVSGHGHAGGSSESGGGGRYYQTSPSVSKNSLPLPLPPKKEPSSGGGLKLLSSRKDKEEKKEKKEREKREKAFRKSAFASSSHGSSSSAQNSASGSGGPHHRSSFSLLRGSTTANSSAEALMGRTPGRVSESSAGSDERERERERNNKFARRPTLFGGVYDRR